MTAVTPEPGTGPGTGPGAEPREGHSGGSEGGGVARTGCDRATWDRLLASGADLDAATVGWLVRQAGGWPDYGFADREALFTTLLTSAVPLTETHLVRLADPDTGEGVPTAAAAELLLGHPAAGLRVACALARSCTDPRGGPAGTRPEHGSAVPARQLLRLLATHPRQRVRVVARMYAAGLARWHPQPPPTPDGHEDPGRFDAAHARVLARLAEVDDAGVWPDLERLQRTGQTLTGDLVAAVVAAAGGDSPR